jgi:DNA-binding transcriptional LysR family regulator
MINIPTELLRTLLAVVEMRSFTKAAQSLGITQPAVSTHMKRLQQLLGGDVFDKSAPGVALTEKGELVVNYARRMLALNDQMLKLAEPPEAEQPLRIGMPGDFGGMTVPSTLAAFRTGMPSLRYRVRSAPSENLLRDLREGHLDLALALTTAGPALDARHYWTEEVVWVRGIDHSEIPQPLQLASYGEGYLLHHLATSVLNQVDCEYELVFTAFSMTGLVAAVAAGLGVSLIPRRSMNDRLTEWESGPMHNSLKVYCGLYVREGVERDVIAPLADSIAEALRGTPINLADRAHGNARERNAKHEVRRS